jgi:hypothetical protein
VSVGLILMACEQGCSGVAPGGLSHGAVLLSCSTVPLRGPEDKTGRLPHCWLPGVRCALTRRLCKLLSNLHTS